MCEVRDDDFVMLGKFCMHQNKSAKYRKISRAHVKNRKFSHKLPPTRQRQHCSRASLASINFFSVGANSILTKNIQYSLKYDNIYYRYFGDKSFLLYLHISGEYNRIQTRHIEPHKKKIH